MIQVCDSGLADLRLASRWTNLGAFKTRNDKIYSKLSCKSSLFRPFGVSLVQYRAKSATSDVTCQIMCYPQDSDVYSLS